MDLAVRELRLAPRRGERLNGSIHPLGFHHPRLAAALADELLDLRSSFSLSDGTTYNYRRVLVLLLRALPQELPRGTCLETGGDALVDALDGWERSLAGKFPPTSIAPNEYPRRIRRLLKNRLARGRVVHARVAQWADGESLHPAGTENPLDEHSNAERLAIRDGCRDRIRDMEERLRQGQSLLDEGKDPRLDGWHSLPNLVWAARHLTRPGESTIVRQLTKVASALTASDMKLLGSIDTAGRRRGFVLLDRLVALLYPTDVELMAFRTLLQLETGAAPDELTDITVDDIEWRDDHAALRLHKARARRSRTIRLRHSSSSRHDGWRGGDVLRRLVEATQRCRSEVDSANHPHANRVFLSMRRRLGASPMEYGRPDQRAYRFLLQHLEAEISKPHDPRRLRKTVKSVRAAVLRSVESAAADDHSVAVFQRHYAHSTTVHMLAGTSIANAQGQVFTRIQSGPTFVGETAIESAERHSEPQVVAAAQAELSRTGTDRQLNVAHCSDPFASPFEPAGRLCQHRPAGCFACPNAIVFRDHLPRLLAYRDVLDGHQREMAPAVFAATHGQQLVNLNRILAEFDAPDVAAARTELRQSESVIHIPLSQRGSHL